MVGEQLWLQITEPTEKDTGKYAIEFHNGKDGLKRTVELSGKGEEIPLIREQPGSNRDLYTPDVLS